MLNPSSLVPVTNIENNPFFLYNVFVFILINDQDNKALPSLILLQQLTLANLLLPLLLPMRKKTKAAVNKNKKKVISKSLFYYTNNFNRNRYSKEKRL